jgi:RES domain-containing protein
MKVYRTTSLQYDSEIDFLSGAGASQYPGRWNEEGVATVYTSASKEVSLAERVFNSMLNRIEAYNQEQAGGRTNIKDYTYNSIIDVEFLLGVIDVNDGLDIVDLSTQASLDAALKNAKQSKRKLEESKKSIYQLDAWMRHLSSYLADQNKKGIKVKSARVDDGENFVFFEKNLDHDDLKLSEKCSVKISAVSATKFEKLRKGVKASEVCCMVESDLFTGLIEFKQFS